MTGKKDQQMGFEFESENNILSRLPASSCRNSDRQDPKQLKSSFLAEEGGSVFRNGQTNVQVNAQGPRWSGSSTVSLFLSLQHSMPVYEQCRSKSPRDAAFEFSTFQDVETKSFLSCHGTFNFLWELFFVVRADQLPT